MERCHEVSSGLVFGSLFARFVFDTGRSAMSRRSIFSFLLFLACACFLNLAAAQFSAAAPSGPLTCHKAVCAQPTSSCQVLESQSCIHGGGPPRCPAIVNAADGTSCSHGQPSN